MSLRDIQFKPGILTEASDREVGKVGFWKDGQWVRFFNGLPESMGGYQRDSNTSYVLGKARGATDWTSLRGEKLIGVGTHLKLYAWLGSVFYDITPYTSTGTLATATPLTTVSGSALVSVAHTTHGRAVGDYVHFSGMVPFNNIDLNGEYTVTSVTSTNVYVVTALTTASASGTGGGAAVLYSYELAIGSEDSLTGGGWGLGTWDSSPPGGWSNPTTTTVVTTVARTWALDNWGEDMLANPAGGGLYSWDSSTGVSTRASLITTAPATMQAMFVSSEDRHVVALGAQPLGGGANDPMLIRWSSDEDYTVWTPLATNTAGDKRLDQGSTIVCGVKTRGEHLVFTDSYAYSMAFTGPPDIYSFRPLGDNGRIAGPLAARAYSGVVYWMGASSFYLYNGAITEIPCAVHSRVFGDINTTNRAKIVCGVNRKFSEVWWWYPSSGSTELDRYVAYNITDKTWVYGNLARTMYVGDSDIVAEPYAISTDGYLYYHETGLSANGGLLNAYIVSGDVELNETREPATQAGNTMLHVGKYIPDFTTLAGSVNVTFTGKKYPRATETQISGPHTIVPSTQYTNPRLRARQVSVRIESNGIADEWRLGLLRLDQTPHGSR